MIESFENQLTNMKEALTSKERMIHNYENSMADLSSKMNLLKKSIEEKVCLCVLVIAIVMSEIYY